MLCLPSRDLSDPEADRRNAVYLEALADLDAGAFTEACDRLLYSEEWFPSIARIREVAGECAAERGERQRALEIRRESLIPGVTLVCPRCKGLRWVRMREGADPPGVRAGDELSHVKACPSCTRNGVYDRDAELMTIADEHGVPDPRGRRDVDLSAITWPAQLHAFRNPIAGRLDMDALYRTSRELRGLDPAIDERPRPVRGWATVGQVEPIAAPSGGMLR